MVGVTIYPVVILVCCEISCNAQKLELLQYISSKVCFIEHSSSGRGLSLGARDTTLNQNGRAPYSTTPVLEVQAQPQSKAGSSNIRLAI